MLEGISVEQTAATPELQFVCLIGNTFQHLLIPTFAEIVVCRELVFSKYGVFLCTANGQLTRCGLVKSALLPFTITQCRLLYRYWWAVVILSRTFRLGSKSIQYDIYSFSVSEGFENGRLVNVFRWAHR